MSKTSTIVRPLSLAVAINIVMSSLMTTAFPRLYPAGKEVDILTGVRQLTVRLADHYCPHAIFQQFERVLCRVQIVEGVLHAD